jgi:Gpi18-like mannosyltransferase
MKNLSKETKKILYLAFICIVVTFFIAEIGFIVFQNKYSSLLAIWNRWDTRHYLNIAQNGYLKASFITRASIPYLPLYPWLIHLGSLFVGNYLLSALVISNLSFAVALIFFYKLVKIDFPAKVAWSTIFYFSIFPTAYFLHAGYTESLFIMVVLIATYFARRQNWILTGIFGFLATLTRFNGVVLLPFFLTEYLMAKKFKFKSVKIDMLWLFLIPLGFLFYLYLNYRVFGNPFEYLVSLRQDYWQYLTVPWHGLIRILEKYLVMNPADWIIEGGMAVLFWFFGLLCLLMSLKKLRLSYSVFGWLSFLLISSTSTWESIPRFLISIFPIFIFLALVGENKLKGFFITYLFLCMQSVFLILFVREHWAF